MCSASLLSLESLEVPNSPVVYTTGETVLDKFTVCEVVFTAGKNAALYPGKPYFMSGSIYIPRGPALLQVILNSM